MKMICSVVEAVSILLHSFVFFSKLFQNYQFVLQMKLQTMTSEIDFTRNLANVKAVGPVENHDLKKFQCYIK